MKKLLPILLLIIIMCPTVSADSVSSQWTRNAGYQVPLDKSCTLQSGSDIHIRIYEKRYKWRTWDYVLWEGDLKRNEVAEIKCYSGKIRYSYRPEGTDRSFGDNRAICNGNFVRVP